MDPHRKPAAPINLSFFHAFSKTRSSNLTVCARTDEFIAHRKADTRVKRRNSFSYQLVSLAAATQDSLPMPHYSRERVTLPSEPVAAVSSVVVTAGELHIDPFVKSAPSSPRIRAKALPRQLHTVNSFCRMIARSRGEYRHSFAPPRPNLFGGRLLRSPMPSRHLYYRKTTAR